ncbi:hypothetical protein LCGC14_0385010 [marine sediment metagenome]|uniref:Uncharacterized protein n=1 Tax=marine sediment metagenome TaxID=412755 RepID=A0A0F9T717_9ZZZZ
MNIKQAFSCAPDFCNETKPDAKGRVFVAFNCHVNCEFKTMCLKLRGVMESRLNGGLK